VRGAREIPRLPGAEPQNRRASRDSPGAAAAGLVCDGGASCGFRCGYASWLCRPTCVRGAPLRTCDSSPGGTWRVAGAWEDVRPRPSCGRAAEASRTISSAAARWVRSLPRCSSSFSCRRVWGVAIRQTLRRGASSCGGGFLWVEYKFAINYG